MFCISCGAENPASARFCNACGEQLFKPAGANTENPALHSNSTPKVCPECGLLSPASASNCDCGYNFDKGKVRKSSPLDKDSENAHGQLEGVGGWLLLFCIGTTMITPVVAIFTAASSRDLSVWLVELGLASLAIFTGISLWAGRKNALRLVKIYFIVLLCLAALALLGSSSTTTDPSHLEGTPAAVRTLSTVVIWGLYFKKSKRVRNTFGHNL